MASGLATQRGVKLFGVFLSDEVVAPAEQEASADLFGKMMMVVDGAEDKKEKKAKRERARPPRKQELPSEYREEVASRGGEGLQLIMGKIITATDLERNQNRLSMPQGLIQTHFLEGKEVEDVIKKVSGGKQDRNVGVKVKLLDPSMKERDMNLACWNAQDNKDKDREGTHEAETKKKKKSWWFALKNNWVNIAAENGLQVGDAIQIWSFRFKADASLGFVLHKVQPPAPPPPPAKSNPAASATTLNRKRKKTNTTPAAIAIAQTSAPSSSLHFLH